MRAANQPRSSSAVESSRELHQALSHLGTGEFHRRQQRAREHEVAEVRVPGQGLTHESTRAQHLYEAAYRARVLAQEADVDARISQSRKEGPKKASGPCFSVRAFSQPVMF